MDQVDILDADIVAVDIYSLASLHPNSIPISNVTKVRGDLTTGKYSFSLPIKECVLSSIRIVSEKSLNRIYEFLLDLTKYLHSMGIGNLNYSKDTIVLDLDSMNPYMTDYSLAIVTSDPNVFSSDLESLKKLYNQMGEINEYLRPKDIDYKYSIGVDYRTMIKHILNQYKMHIPDADICLVFYAIDILYRSNIKDFVADSKSLIAAVNAVELLVAERNGYATPQFIQSLDLDKTVIDPLKDKILRNTNGLINYSKLYHHNLTVEEVRSICSDIFVNKDSRVYINTPKSSTIDVIPSGIKISDVY